MASKYAWAAAAAVGSLALGIYLGSRRFPLDPSAVADFTGDGKPDALVLEPVDALQGFRVVALRLYDNAHLWKRDDRLWAAPIFGREIARTTVPDGSELRAYALDEDGDGKEDIELRTHTPLLDPAMQNQPYHSWLRGKGDGRFEWAKRGDR